MQEYSGQRRVKPLPKRRRTSDLDPVELAAAYADAVNADPDSALRSPSPGIHPNFASYYQFPSLGSFNDLHSVRIDGLGSFDPQAVTPQPQQQQQQQREIFSSVTTYRNNTSGGNEEDDEHVDGDYVDHLQRPGNTKKRKVPTAHGMLNRANFDDPPGSLSGVDGIAELADGAHGFVGGHLGGTGVPVRVPSDNGLQSGAAAHPRKFRASAATMAGLKRKEMLKSRKRQVLAIVNSLPNTETLALDRALASQLGWYRPTSGIHFRQKPACLRNITASTQRHLISQSSIASASNQAVAPTREHQPFTFECCSTTTERLIAMRAEVTILVEKFQKELDRQAAAAAQAARQAAANSEALTKASSVKSQRTRPSESIKSADNTNSRGGGGGGAPANESAPGLVPPKGKSKKKKRSALANASNPHHLRNYVPSRLPNSGSPSTISAAQVALQFLGPPPIRFLTAELGGGRGAAGTVVSRNGSKRMSGTAPLDDGAPMPDEWICAFCEYDLFYGTEARYRHGIRARKKILRRRRRARERAARTASGVGPAAPAGSTMDEVETEDEAEYEADSPYEIAQLSGPRVAGGGAQQMTAGRTGGDDGAG